jgi:uncharacterized membrane protein YesL
LGKIFNFFSGSENKKGKGVDKAELIEAKKMGMGYFFKLLSRSFRKLTGLNLIFLLCNFVVLFVLYGVSGKMDNYVNAPTNPLYGQLYGIMLNDRSPAVMALNGILGVSTSIRVVSTASKVFIYLSFLLIFTFGLSSIGMTYVTRGMVRGEYVSTWSEFFSAIKKNFKQGIIISILDAVIIFVLVYDLVQYSANTGVFLYSAFYFAILLFIFIYFIMRYYIYTILVTFDLPIKKIYKNAFLLSVLGIKRNILIILGSVLVILASVYLFLLFPSVGLILPGIFTISLLWLIGVYCSYPVINKYMIEPYYEEHPEERPVEPDDEPIFTDKG